MGVLKNRVGEEYRSNVSEKIIIVEYFSSTNCTIQFEDGTLLYNIQFGQLKSYQVPNQTCKI